MSIGIEYIDITQALAKASAALPVGQMVQTEAFSMFEAMSAVEIGNPKMDAAASATPITVDQLINDGAAPLDLSDDQVLAVIDRLMALEATWHHGECAHMQHNCRYGPDRALAQLQCRTRVSTCDRIYACVV